MGLGSERVEDYERIADLERQVRALLDRISVLEATVIAQQVEIVALQG